MIRTNQMMNFGWRCVREKCGANITEKRVEKALRERKRVTF